MFSLYKKKLLERTMRMHRAGISYRVAAVSTSSVAVDNVRFVYAAGATPLTNE